MRFAAIAVTVTALISGLALFGRYDYVQRGGEAVRVDRLTGRTAVLRPVRGGGVVWAALKSPAEIAEEQVTERARCAERSLPESQRDKVSAVPVGRYVRIKNGSTWTVRDVEATIGGAPVLLRRVDDSPKLDPNDPLNEYAIQVSERYQSPRQIVAGYEANFEPTSGVAPAGAVYVVRASGVPGDCH